MSKSLKGMKVYEEYFIVLDVKNKAVNGANEEVDIEIARNNMCGFIETFKSREDAIIWANENKLEHYEVVEIN